jgi:hypothetical protein
LRGQRDSIDDKQISYAGELAMIEAKCIYKISCHWCDRKLEGSFPIRGRLDDPADFRFISRAQGWTAERQGMEIIDVCDQCVLAAAQSSSALSGDNSDSSAQSGVLSK